jgi:hypothetical protein
MEKSGTSPLMDSGEDGQVLNLVRSGKDLRKEDETSFWDDFISLCGNVQGMSDLFGVSPDKIRSWPGKIQEALDKLETHDAESPNVRNDTDVMPTGDNGAVTVNVDPQLGGMQ